MKKQYNRQNATPIQTQNNGKRRKLRKHLNADRLLTAIRKDFSQVKDCRSDNCRINMADALMSGLAVFQLKYPTLLAFDNDRLENPENLRSIFGIRNIPCDSQMRSILDPVDLSELRKPFRTVIGQLQRGKELEKFKFLNDHYLLSCDGTGFYTSDHVTSERCMAKRTRGGVTQYYQQMYAAAFVHPDNKVVLPTCPEMITRQDAVGVKILFASFAHLQRLIYHPCNNPLQQKPTLPTNIQLGPILRVGFYFRSLLCLN
jgi:hypothetical protein